MFRIIPDGLAVTLVRREKTRVFRAGKKVFATDEIVSVSDESLAVAAGIIKKPKATKEHKDGDINGTE